MLSLLLILCLVTLSAGQDNSTSSADNSTSIVDDSLKHSYCAACLHPIWFIAVSEYNNGTDPCTIFSLGDVFECLDTCDMAPVGKPISVRIRQLTQISDIFHSLRANGCPLLIEGNSASSVSACESMAGCVLSVSNYEYQGRDSHAPFSTVFDYKCGLVSREEAALCLARVTGCVSQDRLTKLSSLLAAALGLACDSPRRCVKWGSIFEVKPGSGCTEYYQEAAAYGPSSGNAQMNRKGQGLNPATCGPEYLANFDCPADPHNTPIYTELAPTTTTATLPVLNEDGETVTMEPTVYESITINTNLTCEQCLRPLWFRAVTTSGSHLCVESFQEQVFECLANCKCCPSCDKCADREEQYDTEVLVKLADINKALSASDCQGSKACTAQSYTCTEHLAIFNPKSAPHVTVNRFSCDSADLQGALECYSTACSTSESVLMAATTLRGIAPVCETNMRCMSYGSIFEYVPVSKVDVEDGGHVEPCANFKKIAANGWRPSTAIHTSKQGLIFSTENCYEDWPANVECPPELSQETQDPGMAAEEAV